MLKVGEWVKVTWNDNGTDEYVGTITTIEAVDPDSKYCYKLKGIGCSFCKEEIVTWVKPKGVSSMVKYYRVEKDTFIWKEGAILEFDSSLGNDGGYKAINDLWDTCELNGEWITRNIIEAPENSDTFARVYNVGKQDKMVFATKEKAREMANSMFTVEGKK